MTHGMSIEAQRRQELLAQLGARVLEILREAKEAKTSRLAAELHFHQDEIKSAALDEAEEAARSLGLLGDTEGVASKANPSDWPMEEDKK